MSEELTKVLEREVQERERILGTLHRVVSQHMTSKLPDGRIFYEATFITADAEALRALAEGDRVQLIDDDGGRYAVAVDLVCPWSGRPVDERDRVADGQVVLDLLADRFSKGIERLNAEFAAKEADGDPNA